MRHRESGGSRLFLWYGGATAQTTASAVPSPVGAQSRRGGADAPPHIRLCAEGATLDAVLRLADRAVAYGAAVRAAVAAQIGAGGGECEWLRTPFFNYPRSTNFLL